VQDTFLEALRDFGKFQGDSWDELLAWLRQILLHNLADVGRRYCATEKRRIQREIDQGAASWKLLLEAVADAGSTPSAQTVRQERDETQLPERERTVIAWRTYEHCSFEEIGRRLQRSARAARKLWARAVERLQRILGPGDESQ
jgi:RNA polymerase sigma-70 factor (ECF subfamily)